jgi:benzoyl-CoA reductase subunit A
MQIVEDLYKTFNVSFDDLVSVYDKAIIRSENEVNPLSLSDGIEKGLREQMDAGTIDDNQAATIRNLLGRIEKEVVINSMVGTGYGRQLLPFPKENIYSEILCHGLGSHHFFPNTRTVLDIGGQDTKAIQVDESGMVTSFNMNDRCAAGCGRFLGYIADQLSIGVQDLSELAFKARKVIKISSTCTVFSGAEMRSKLNLGERREDLVLSLETAMAKRAMSLIARSGGISNEFTFSGGVAKNQSMVSIFDGLVKEHYGDIKMNVSPDSIYAGALGAALFAKRKVG